MDNSGVLDCMWGPKLRRFLMLHVVDSGAAVWFENLCPCPFKCRRLVRLGFDGVASEILAVSSPRE